MSPKPSDPVASETLRAKLREFCSMSAFAKFEKPATPEQAQAIENEGACPDPILWKSEDPRRADASLPADIAPVEDTAIQCSLCGSEFGFTVWRHDCHLCGEVRSSLLAVLHCS